MPAVCPSHVTSTPVQPSADNPSSPTKAQEAPSDEGVLRPRSLFRPPSSAGAQAPAAAEVATAEKTTAKEPEQGEAKEPEEDEAKEPGKKCGWVDALWTEQDHKELDFLYKLNIRKSDERLKKLGLHFEKS